MKPTLKNIATQLGVSKATVSNVFNKPEIVSPVLRDKVLAYCEKVGYSGPSVAARSLNTGKTGVVGVMLCDSLVFSFTDPAATQFLAGVAQALDEYKATLLLLPTSEEHYQNSPVETMVDSYILYGEPVDSRIMTRLLRQSKTVVTVDFQNDGEQCRYIGIDDTQACLDIAQFAIAKHKQVHQQNPQVMVLGLRLNEGSITGPVDMEQLYEPEISVSRKRLDGYLLALEQESVSIEKNDIWHLPWLEHDAIRTIVRGILTDSAKPRPQLLLCMSDKVALAALEAAQQLGIEVPKQLQIVGFDDIAKAEEHGLTTVSQPIVEKGQQAARMAMGEGSDFVVLETQRIERNSTL